MKKFETIDVVEKVNAFVMYTLTAAMFGVLIYMFALDSYSHWEQNRIIQEWNGGTPEEVITEFLDSSASTNATDEELEKVGNKIIIAYCKQHNLEKLPTKLYIFRDPDWHLCVIGGVKTHGACATNNNLAVVIEQSRSAKTDKEISQKFILALRDSLDQFEWAETHKNK